MPDESVVRGRLHGWVRVSHHNSQLDSQREVVSSFARRNGVVVVRWWEDQDRPRWKAAKSEVLAAMVKAAEDRQFDWLVLDKQQRFGTFSNMEFSSYMWTLRKAGVRVWSVEEGELTTDEIAASFTSIAKSHSEVAEQRNKAGNVARGMLHNARQGRYNGSIMPHGYDRVCLSPEGVERFRLVEESRVLNPDAVAGSPLPEHSRYIRKYTVIYTGGHTESLTQLPGKGKADRYEYRVSVRAERVDEAVEVYRMYDSGLNLFEIAKALNRTGGSRGLKTEWTAHSVRSVLENPIYGGIVGWKRTMSAKYMSISKDGSYIQSEYDAALGDFRAATVPTSERVYAEPREELRIVDDPLIERVRARLAQAQKREVKPRADSLWLRTFLRCGHCGGPMYGAAREGASGTSHFRCSRYHRDKQRGDGGATCVGNRVELAVVEAKLEVFLARYGRAVSIDLDRPAAKLAGLLLPFGDEGVVLANLRREMRAYVTRRMPAHQRSLLDVEGGVSLLDAYQHYFALDSQEDADEVGKIVDEIRAATKALRRVDEGGEAERQILEEIRELEARKSSVDSRSTPLDRRIAETIVRLEAIEESIRAVKSHQESRRTREAAESLRGVLASIEVYSRPSGYTGGARTARIAERLVFRPIEGQAVELEVEPPTGMISDSAISRAKSLLAAGENLNRICKILDAEGLRPPHAARWSRKSLAVPLAEELAALPPEARDGRSRLHRRARHARNAQ